VLSVTVAADHTTTQTQTHTHTHMHGKAPLDEGSARRRDLYQKHATFTNDRHQCPQRDQKHATFTNDRHQCPQRDSNSQSMQASSHIPTP